jgi:chemotaxis protein MotB
LIFFVRLFSNSKVNKEKFNAVAKSIAQSINNPAPLPPPAPPAQKQSTAQPLELAQSKLEDLIKREDLESKIQTNLTATGLMIELASHSFFDSGSADIRASMESSLIDLSQVILSLPVQSYKVDHTDNAPINTRAFPSNWELAALRSINVLHLFHENGIPKQELSVSAFADTRPKFPNVDSDNEPIAENQAKNRRVVVHRLNMTATELQ